MAERNGPSGARNFFGGLVDRILPGSNYNRQTGQFSNLGSGIAGRAASVAGTVLGGPAVGRLISTGANNWINTGSPLGTGYGTGPLARLVGRDANTVGDVVRQPIGDVRPSGGNLGLGGGATAGVAPGGVYRDPYLGWQQFLAPQGSIDNFGNNNIRTQPAVGGGWQPSSQWGRDMLNGGADNGGGNRFFGSDQFSSGRGGATTVTDPTAASAITSWAAGAAMNPGFRAFSRAKK